MEPAMILPTAPQIEALRTEAANAGDDAQIAICDRAIEGDREALLECAIAIDDALAQADE